jgi:hypothetical protein
VDEQEEMGTGSAGAGEANIIQRSLHSALKLQAKSSKHADTPHVVRFLFAYA